MRKTQNHRNVIEQWLAVGGGWRWAVGGWWLLAVGVSRFVAVSLRAVLNKKRGVFLRTVLVWNSVRVSWIGGLGFPPH